MTTSDALHQPLYTADLLVNALRGDDDRPLLAGGSVRIAPVPQGGPPPCAATCQGKRGRLLSQRANESDHPVPEAVIASDDSSIEDPGREDAGPRAILRVPEVLMAVAASGAGMALGELAAALKLPKTSLHRLLRTLEHGGFVVRAGGLYRPGPESFRLAAALSQAAPAAQFPACARPVLEALADESGETVMLSVISDKLTESVYLEVIESPSLLRFAMRAGNRRPLFAVASGKAMLAFQPAEQQARYLDQAEFFEFSTETTRKEEMPALLRRVRESGVVYDRNGIVDGASGVASPVFDTEGRAFCAVSIAGPTERMDARRGELEALVRDAGQRISRILGYAGPFPPA
ncbi:MAG: IclR family transcriptional regulator [Novosphingobium sp.]